MNAALKMPWLDLRFAFNGDPLPEPTPSAIPVAELAPTAGQPNCPKCGRPMTGGAPHGPWPVQWECRPCGVYINADEPPDCPKCRLGRIKGNFGEEDAADQWCGMCGWPVFDRPYAPARMPRDTLAKLNREEAARSLDEEHELRTVLLIAAETLEASKP